MSDYDVFARTYDREFGKLTDDLGFYTDLAGETGGPALEMAVGTGRVALAVARAGTPVVGVDASPAMLAKLREKLEAEPDLPVTAVRGDMRTADVTDRGPFGLVYCPARAFLHLLTVEDQLAAVRNARRHLREDGLFAGNVFWPRVDLLSRRSGSGEGFVAYGEFEDPDSGRRAITYESSRVDLRRHLIRATFRAEELTDTGEIARTELRDVVLTWIWPRELEHLLWRAGFELAALYGDFERTPFEEGGGELVWIARRRDG
jgi:SAM-dependent methyltransferase